MGSVEASFELIKNDPSKILGMTVGKHKVTTPGQHIPKAEAQFEPEITFTASTGTYVMIELDLDAPFRSFHPLSPILHWIQPGLTPTPTADGLFKLSYSAQDTPFIVDFAPPGPPDASGPHRYIFMLYEQPEGFDASKFGAGKKVGLWKRIRYDLAAFEKEAKLGPVIAFNYFICN